MDFEAPEDISNDGNYINEPGTYHIVVTEICEGESIKGNPIDGFTFGFDVLAGTTENCAGKSGSQSLFAPNLTGTDKQQLLAKKKLAAFFIATGVLLPEQLGKSVKINVPAAVGQQLILTLSRKMEKDDNGNYTVETKLLEINYSDIFHVDDPAAKSYPKSEDALGMIDAKDRHKPGWFAFKAKGGSRPTPVAAKTEPPVDVAAMFG